MKGEETPNGEQSDQFWISTSLFSSDSFSPWVRLRVVSNGISTVDSLGMDLDSR